MTRDERTNKQGKLQARHQQNDPQRDDPRDEQRDDNDEDITLDADIKAARVGRSGQWGDPTEPPVVEISLEEIRALHSDLEGDDTLGDIIQTNDTDGSTNNVHLAMDQGLVYTPPTDPPVVPSDDLQGVEVAAGFGESIEDEPEIANLPASVDNNDFDAEDDIRKALRYNSETTHLDDVRVYVRDGVAYLRGTVLDEDDIAIVDEFVRDLDFIDDIRNELEVAES